MSRAAAALVPILVGCTPQLPPGWVLQRDTELAMRVEVVAQGPYGNPLDPDAPSVNEALPLDTIEATPYVVAPDGPVDLGTLHPQWYLCDDLGTCLIRGDATQFQPCDNEYLLPTDPCLLDGGSTVRLQLGDFFAVDQPDQVFAINRAPTLGFIAGSTDGPSTASCVASVAARTSVDDCLWMERQLHLGSLGEVVDGLASLGYQVDVSDSLKPALEVPRNHNPTVRELQVGIDGADPVAYVPGQTVRVAVGASVHVEYRPDPMDVDTYEVTFQGDKTRVEDIFVGHWFASREVAELDQSPTHPPSVTWRATVPEPVTLHFVLTDDRHGEAWGWLHFELSR